MKKSEIQQAIQSLQQGQQDQPIKTDPAEEKLQITQKKQTSLFELEKFNTVVETKKKSKKALTQKQMSFSLASTESNTRENRLDNNNSALKFGNMVSNTDQASKIRASKDRGVRNDARPKKQKITTNQKQDMIFTAKRISEALYKK
ncbi:hypothetical protein BB561_001600 [Smittium simulii]|uniref:Uncharacterized protein n=1 Tax=Smittium simulii TaxID=133385 RepID=A0A2T9YTX4_9FUNG|nr:hypothetical protein BB561_001600 [Smittium simulii]